MAGFRFRLSTLLKLREVTRDERRSHLAEAYAADEKLRERRGAVERELAQLKKTSTAQSLGEINVDRLLSASRFDALLRTEIEVVRQQETRLAGEIEKRRQALVAADREVRMLEKLRETHLERHRQQEAHLSNKQLDEIGSRRIMDEERT